MKLTIITYGAYSSYSIVTLVQGPDDVTVEDMVKRFLVAYVDDDATCMEDMSFRHRSRTQERLRAECIPLIASELDIKFGVDIEWLFVAWLIMQPGWSIADHTEKNIGEIDR